jgi:hypothetical protein
MPDFLIDQDTGLLAAEFVLGTLDSPERAKAQALLKSDHSFIAMVRIWERRFGELHLMVEPIEPDPSILDRVRARIGIPAPSQSASPAEQPAELPLPPPQDPKPEGAAVVAPPSAPEGEPRAEAEGASLTDTAKPSEPSAAPQTPEPAPALDVVGAALAAIPTGELGPTGQSESGSSAPAMPAAANLPEVPPTQPVAAPELTERASDRPQGRPAERPQNLTMKVARSRSRWRAFGLLMTLVLFALGGLIAAWRFAPDRLPARLRPSEVMMSLGIEPVHSQPAPKPALPPESQFDE